MRIPDELIVCGAMELKPRRNYRKIGFGSSGWKCANCGCSALAATFRSKGETELGPYNMRQKYCSPDCRAAAADARAEIRAAERARAWSCRICGGGRTDFVKGRGQVCSPKCKLDARNEVQSEYRLQRTISQALDAVKRRETPTYIDYLSVCTESV